jgi:uncharacterized Ntn-hydrolase superfamily protein
VLLTRKADAFKTSGTFSILAISNDMNQMGVAVISGSTHVGDRVPHGKPGIGVIATQAYTNVTYGTEGLKLLHMGFSPEEILKNLLKKDAEKNLRQVAIMDFKRRKTVFTGTLVPEVSAEVIKENCIAIGNLLSSPKVVEAMADEFENTSEKTFALRLISALKTGKECSGDKRGERSAALIVVNKEKVKVQVKVDLHENPMGALLSRLQAKLMM